jgi:hypothetical protein
VEAHPATSVWAGVVAPTKEIGGRYCEDCHVAHLIPDNVPIDAITERCKQRRGALEEK